MRAGQGKKWGQVGATPGHIRWHGSWAILFVFLFVGLFVCLRHSPLAQTAFTVRTGVCAVGWARKATERKRGLLKLSKGRNKNTDGREKTGGGREGENRSLKVCTTVDWCVCVCVRIPAGGRCSEWCRNLSLVSQSRRCDPHLITACLHWRTVTTSSTITNYWKYRTKLWISFGKFCQCSSKRKYLTR